VIQLRERIEGIGGEYSANACIEASIILRQRMGRSPRNACTDGRNPVGVTSMLSRARRLGQKRAAMRAPKPYMLSRNQDGPASIAAIRVASCRRVPRGRDASHSMEVGSRTADYEL